MGTKILPQAVLSVPRNPRLFAPRKSGFCTSISGRSYVLDAGSRISFSSFSSSSVSCHFNPIVVAPKKREFFIRAESNSEAEAETLSDAEEVVEGTVEEPAEAEEEKPPRKPRVKLGDVMGILNKRAIEEFVKERPVPDIRTGDIVQIKLEVPENKRRLSVYKGIVISRQNAGIHTTIRIRRIIAGVGVEIVFPLYSPNIKEIKVVSHRKVRRARLYYLRDKLPRLSTFK